MNILHIISDPKFVDLHIKKFKDSNYDNHFVYFNDRLDYSGENDGVIEFVATDESGYRKLLHSIEDYDIVILYFLEITKLKLLERIETTKAKLVWSFYGAELYALERIKSKMLSYNTKVFLYGSSMQGYIRFVKRVLRPVILSLKGQLSIDKRLQRIFPKISRFTWYNKYEYDYLNRLCNSKLPRFLLSSVSHVIPRTTSQKPNTTKIIIGNSGSIYNNHLDGLQLLHKGNYKGQITLPFNYGGTEEYKNYLKKHIHLLEISIIDKMMPYTEYIDFVQTHTTAIYPSYRQMGLGNIVIAIQCNLKIYLSKRNPTYGWLKEEGLKIFSIEQDLMNDLITGNLILDQEEIEINKEQYAKITNKENNRLYFKQLEELADSNSL